MANWQIKESFSVILGYFYILAYIDYGPILDSFTTIYQFSI